MTTAIQFEGVGKRFGGVQALTDVSFAIDPGEVHAVVGENGAGKSTLMKMLAGVHLPDRGRILLRGKAVRLHSPLAARSAGISIVYQELRLFPHRTVAANVFAGRERASGGFLQRREMNRAATEALGAIGVRLDPDMPVGGLSIGEKQLVEIARSIAERADIVILDEPNSALTEGESARLFEIIGRLRDQGATVLYVSHRLDEVFSIADRITVLRDGRYVGTWKTVETTVPQIITQMIGRPPAQAFPERPAASAAETLLAVESLAQADRLGPISFEVRRGEILGFAGLEGAGVERLFRILFGLERPDGGEIRMGAWARGFPSPSDAIRAGWGMIPASRRDQGLMMPWSVQRNMTLLVLDRLTGKLGRLSSRQGRGLANELARRLKVVTDSVDRPVMDLSGGNQQKVLLAKWLAAEPRILILNDPTRGVDVGAKAEIYALIRTLAQRGVGILLASSEIEETVGLSDRILALYRGRVCREFGRGASKAEVLHAMSGG